MFLGLLPALVAAGPAVAGDDTGSVEYCADDEHAVFYGDGDDFMVALSLPDETPADGQYLVLYARLPEGAVIRLRGPVGPGSAFASGRVVPLSGGGYSYVRVRDGDECYVLYSGIGRFAGNGDGPVSVHGLAIEKDGELVRRLDLGDDCLSELGPELFDAIGLPEDDDEFMLPLDAPVGRVDVDDATIDALAALLEGRAARIRDAGRKAVFRDDGQGIVAGEPCRFFSFGEDVGDRIVVHDHYAVTSSGLVYKMDILGGGKYRPL